MGTLGKDIRRLWTIGRLIDHPIYQSRLVTFPNVPMRNQLFLEVCQGLYYRAYRRCLNNEVAVTIYSEQYTLFSLTVFASSVPLPVINKFPCGKNKFPIVYFPGEYPEQFGDVGNITCVGIVTL